MLKPDAYFKQYHYYFRPINRQKARLLFRRAIREFYAMQRKYVIEPETGKRVKSVFYGMTIKQQKNQRRKVKLLFKGRSSAGRPSRPEIKYLISRLFILWGRYAESLPTFSWIKKDAIQTDFEVFLSELLPRLGASNVKRYLETHWSERKVKINGV